MSRTRATIGGVARWALVLMIPVVPPSLLCQAAEQEPGGAKHHDFLKNFKIETLGLDLRSGSGPNEQSESNMSLRFGQTGLSCQVCTPGWAAGRTRTLLPDFGARVTYSALHGRLSLSAAFRGTDVVSQPGAVFFSPLLFRATSFNDDWITHSDFSARFALDHAKHSSVGFTHSMVNSFGTPTGHWTEDRIDVTIDPALVKQVLVKFTNSLRLPIRR